MEISKQIIDEAFDMMENLSTNEELYELLDSLKRFSIEDLLLKSKNNDILRNIDSSIWDLVNSSSITNNADNYCFEIINTIKQFLDNAISEGEIKSLLIFLKVNCYLNIELNSFNSNRSFPKEIVQKLSGNILILLQKIQFGMKLENDASFFEKKLNVTNVEGIQEENIDKVYNLIQSIERGGRGFHFNYLLECLVSFYFQLDIVGFLTYLDSLSDPMIIVFHLQSFSKAYLIQIINSNKITSKWGLFELTRQIIEKEDNNDDVSITDIDSMVHCLSTLYNSDAVFYGHVITYFHRSKLFNSALGYQLKEIGKKEILNVFNIILPINKYSNNIDSRSILLEQFCSNIETDTYKSVLNTVFTRWLELYNSIAEAKDFYQNELLLTDYADYIVAYYTLLNEEEIVSIVDNIINKLIWINSEWFSSQTKQITKYRLYFTSLYLLSFAYKENGIVNSKINKLFEVLEDDVIYEIEDNTSNDTCLKIIHDNIYWRML